MQKPELVPRYFISVQEGMDSLAVKRTFFYKMLNDGRIDSIKLGGRRLVFRHSVEKLIETRRRQTISQ